MRVYQNIHEMYDEVQRDLKEMGVIYTSATVQDKQVNEPTKELYNYAYVLTGWADLTRECHAKGIHMDWLYAEEKDRLAWSQEPKNPGRAWEYNVNFWGQFMRDGRFAYTYAERLHPQIPHVIHELRQRSNTRQAILTMYDQHQDIMNFGGRDRIPCSMHYQFLIRQGELHMNYVMRSCDFHRFFLSDVYHALSLMNSIAQEVQRPLGTFTHFIGSLHAFEKDMENVF